MRVPDVISVSSKGLVFGVWCSVFVVRCSVFGVRCSLFVVRCSVFGDQCSVFARLSRGKLFVVWCPAGAGFRWRSIWCLVFGRFYCFERFLCFLHISFFYVCIHTLPNL